MNAILLCLTLQGIIPNSSCDGMEAVLPAARLHRLDPHLILAVAIHESRWTPTARNGSHCGLMQTGTKFVPETCQELMKPETAIWAGARALRYWTDHKGKDRAIECYRKGNKCLAPGYEKAVLATVKVLQARSEYLIRMKVWVPKQS